VLGSTASGNRSPIELFLKAKCIRKTNRGTDPVRVDKRTRGPGGGYLFCLLFDFPYARNPPINGRIFDMKNIFAALAALGTLAVGVSYSPSIATGATNAPVAVSWFLFSVASTLSFFTAWSSGRRSFSENPMNSVDLVITWGILLVIIFLGRDVRWTYNPVEVGCLVASGIVGIWWRTSKKKGKDVISNLAI